MLYQSREVDMVGIDDGDYTDDYSDEDDSAAYDYDDDVGKVGVLKVVGEASEASNSPLNIFPAGAVCERFHLRAHRISHLNVVLMCT
jgi:hypothetical protein